MIIVDDPHKPDEVQSDVRRTAVLEWYKSTLLSRCNDPANTPIIVIQQRIHEHDLAGMLLEQGGWTHLNLQAEAEEARSYDLGPHGMYHCQEGELLHPARLSEAVLESYKASLGSYVYAAQSQQRPAPLEGGIVKWAWFKQYDTAPTDACKVIQSWDTASCVGEHNDYSVCTTWRVKGENAWLVDLWRGRLEFPELIRKVRHLAARWSADEVLIEQAGSGLSLLQDLNRRGGLNVTSIIPQKDKNTRLLLASAVIESGRVALPKDAPWLVELRRVLTLFPNARYDDQVDSISQFLNWHDTPKFQWYVGGKSSA